MNTGVGNLRRKGCEMPPFELEGPIHIRCSGSTPHPEDGQKSRVQERVLL
jgi:hypothetical protein